MKKLLLPLITILISGCAIAAASGEINWYTDLDEGLAVAKKEGKIIMVDVYTDWCSWCKELDKRTYVHEDVVKLSKKMINVKINPEKDARAETFAKKVGVRGYPAIFFIDADESVLLEQIGFIEGEPFAKIMQKVLNFGKIDEFKEEFSSGKMDNAQSLFDMLIAKGELKDAEEVLTALKASEMLGKEDDAKSTVSMGFAYMQQTNYPAALRYLEKMSTTFRGTSSYYEGMFYYIYSMLLGNEEGKAINTLETFLAENEELDARYKNPFLQLQQMIEQEKSK